MKALSLTPPWGQLIRDGQKTIETRKWKTKYRGDVLICCSQKPRSDESGMALCVATIVDCRRMEKEDEEPAMIEIYPRANSWVLENVRKIIPFPVKGRLGLFDVPEDNVQPDGRWEIIP